jgi:phosphohistidine swiveling domain-containing protein
MEKYIFDNSNIAESYSGVTTPLTYSFARDSYQQVYKSFCRMMGVRPKLVEQHEDMFSRMVVFIGHRIYYDLINWYKLVSFLPGYKFNRGFFEKMLGVEKGYEYSGNGNSGIFERYFIILPRLLLQSIGILNSFLMMGHLIRKFNRRFDRIFRRLEDIDLSSLSMEELHSLYLRLHKDLSSQWSVPIANDFAVMVSTGLADKLFKIWLNESSVYFYLYSKSHLPLISLDPGLEISKIAFLIKADPAIRGIFENEEDAGLIMRKIKEDFPGHIVTRSISEYLKKFGIRSPNELKLETITLKEKPEMLMSLLRRLLNSEQAVASNPVRENRIEPENYNTLSPIKKGFIRWSLGWALKSIHRREEARFRRALIFGYVRKFFTAIGEKLCYCGVLDTPCDIFYLTTEEIFGLIKNEPPKDVFKNIVRNRIGEFEYWHSVDLPRRIETSKSITALEADFKAKHGYKKAETRSGVLKGIVASRPKADAVSGTALVLPEFDPSADFEGKILVTKQTDPGWTVVFHLLKGLVVERGGMLSHAAIVARELNIPCVVGVDSATAFIKDGSQIRIDLNKGEIYA